MKNQIITKTSLPLILSLMAAAALTACGGGSGGGSSTPSADGSGSAKTFTYTCADKTSRTSTVSLLDAQSQCPSNVTSSLVTSVPALTYPAGSEELAALTLLNAQRQHCGFGLLKQNAKLDVAAKGHADWLVLNGYSGHFQSAGTPGFTGVAPEDRMTAAGYGAAGSFEHSETANTTGGAEKDKGVWAVRGLLNAPYHLMAMIRGYRDVGVAVRTSADAGDTAHTRLAINIDYAAKKDKGYQTSSAGTVRTYPCEGSTGVDYALRNESPNPVPGRNLGSSPIGSTVAIVGDAGTTLTITSASMTGPAGAVTLLAPITSKNDPNKVSGVSYFFNNEAFITPDAPLLPSTTYQVNISGTNDGKPFSRSFGFTTGTGS